MVNVSPCCWVRDILSSTIVSPLDGVIRVAWCCMFFCDSFLAATKPSTWSSSVVAFCASMILFHLCPCAFHRFQKLPFCYIVRFWAIKQGDVEEDILDRDTSDDESLAERPAWSPWWRWIWFPFTSVFVETKLPPMYGLDIAITGQLQNDFWAPKNFGVTVQVCYVFGCSLYTSRRWSSNV